jgi:hypothetical protein
MPAGPRRVSQLWCGACGRVEECPPDAFDRYARDGWPRCCGQVMSYFREPDPTGPDDDPARKPPPPPLPGPD